MKIQSLRFTVFLLICLLNPLMVTAQAVEIPDAKLRAKIETVLGKPAATITEAEMATLARLKVPYSEIRDLPGSEIRDLTGLEHATGLTSLDLRHNLIEDISPLAGLTKLEELHLDNNSISDISPLAKLTKMRWLFLSNNSISNIEPLAKLTRMGTLKLADNSVSDISALSGFNNLNLLDLSKNSVSDISALKGLRLLNAVVLVNNSVSDIEPLVANQRFKKFLGTDAFLYLRGNPLSDTSINTHVPTLRARGVIVDIGPTIETLAKVSGDNQQGVINTALVNPFVVEVQDENGSALSSGREVTFSITRGGGTLSVTGTTTDDEGRASSTLTLGPGEGTNTVSVSAEGIQRNVIFTAEAVEVLPSPTTLLKISGDNQQGVINTALGNPFVVEVRDQTDSVLSGIEVTFTVTAGGGTLGTTSTTTNTNGRASSTLTLGSSVGTNTVSVSAAGIQGVETFTAEAQSSPPPPTATTLVKISGDNQQGVINTALGNPFVVEVRDQTDSVLSGIEVTFTVTAGGGTLGTTSTTTNTNGRASSTLTLGSSVGTNTVSVSAAGIQGGVTFTAEGVVVVSIPDPNLRAKIETALGKVSGASITLREMATLTSLDGSNASISDLTGLEFAIGLTTLNLSGNSVTDLSPLVSNTGLGSGDTVDVRGNPLSYVSITTHIPALQSRGVTVYFDTRTATTLVKISGDNQQGVINTALANPFVVEVRDEDGDPFAGVTVTFTVPTGGGMLSTTSPITNVNGRAESQLTLGSSVGTNTVSVSVAGISQTVPFTAEAVAEPPPLPPPLPQPPPQPPQQTATTLVKISGDNQQGVINTALVNPFIVEVRDENNNPFLGGAVTFAVTAGGGTLSVPSTTTDADGRAKSTLTLGPGLSQNTVSVSAAGISEMVTFTAEGVVVVLIPDPNLRAKIETALGKVSGASITLREMATLTSLDGSNASISDLTGLEFAIGLTTLNLSGNSVTDLSPLVSNTGLGSGDTVDVRGNPLSYVSITTHIPALQSRGVTVYFDSRTATTLVKISGDGQQGVINTALGNPFIVEVRDEDGDPFAGVTVTFTVPTGGGMLSTTGPTTNVNGRAESILTLGPSMGTNTVSVSAAGISQTVTFTAEAVAGQPPPQPTATTLVKISGDEQQGVINTALANPFVVEVRDENNSALSGILVTFSVTTGGGRLNPESTRTDASGRASSRLTLGSSVGTNTVSVSAAGIQEGVTFTAEAVTAPPPPPPPTATTLVKISGDNQQGVINTILGSSFVVEVRDESSDPLEGVAVTFSIIDGGGMLSAISTTTNANGRAESWLTLGSSVGTNTVSVSAAGIQEGVTFTAEAVTGPQPPSPPRDPPPSTATTLVKISGDNQQGVVNTILGSPFVVEVRDESSDPLEDVAVTFSIIAGGGTLSAISTTTNANGRAESTLTLGSSVGTNTVSVSATGIQEGVTFTAEAVADPQPTSPPPQPSQPTMTLVKISGDNQHGVVNTILGSPFVVEVRDKSSDPLKGVAVTFSIIAGGGTLSAISTMTDANGRAESWLTLGSSVGTNTVSVSAAGIQEGVTFTAEAVAGPQPPSDLPSPPQPPLSTATTLVKISGDNQQGVINMILGRPFVVEVRDESSEPLEGVAVRFSIIAGGGTLSAISTTTDASGRAESWLTLGSNVGTNAVSVSAAGIQDGVTFTAIAETSQFDLSVPSGISLIHIPLKVTSVNGIAMTIESVGDLYDALGGANTVNYLITYNPTSQQWLCYMGPLCRGMPVNKILTDSEGIIAVMNHAVSLRLGGSPLGTPLLSKREALITLHRGINLVGMPLRDSRIARVSDLFSLEGIEDNVCVMIVLDNGTFKVIGRAGDDGDIQITGGQSYVLIAQIDAAAVISGDGWSTVPGIASAPPMALIGIQAEDTTPVLAVTGLVVSPVGKRGRMPRLRSGAGAGFRVTVKNLSTGRGGHGCDGR